MYRFIILFIALCCSCAQSYTVIVVGPPPPHIEIIKPPSFAIADYGYEHDLNAEYVDFYSGDPQSGYSYHYEALSEIPGMEITDNGIVEFLPSADQVGESYTAEVQVTLYDGGSNLLQETCSFTNTVIAENPQFVLSEVPGQPFGAFGLARTKYSFDLNVNPNDNDWRFFRLYLVDPPAGVILSKDYEGRPALEYPTSEFGEEITRIPLHLRYEMETLAGTVSAEMEFVQELLPEPPSSDLSDNWDAYGNAFGATMGFSLAGDGVWVIAGEPFIGDTSLSAPAGRVNIWHMNPSTGALSSRQIVSPDKGSPGEAFGASVAIQDSVDGMPPVAVVGVPEASGGTAGLEENVGRIDVFERGTNGVWAPVASLTPPQPATGLYAGGKVGLSGDTIIASMDGADHAGPSSGALAVYQRSSGSNDWEWVETLIAPDAGARDYFGFPSAVDGNWIAAAANEDDDAGLNAGAVHLFERDTGGFVHRQKILSPEPQGGALFGEALELSEEWLFISAFRQDANTGAVYAYRLIDGTWTYQQRLNAPVATENSGFGFSLSVRDQALCVSAPGHFGELAKNGVTLYLLKEGIWTWANHRPGELFGNADAFGFSVAQITARHSLTGVPFDNLNQGRDAAGRVIRFEWPECTPETFEDAIAALPNATAEGDEDENGVPNLLQWMMGHSVESVWFWEYFPACSRPFVDVQKDRIQFVIPPIERGWNYEVDIMVSTDCRNWIKAEDVQWEQIRRYEFYDKDHASSTFVGAQPLTIPLADHADALFMRLRIR
jgi:hypothetical protein